MATAPHRIVSLRDYASVLWRRKGYIVVFTAIVVGAALFYSFRQTPIYQSQAEVLVLPVDFSPTEPASQGGFVNMVNEVRVVTSTRVAALAAGRLRAQGLPIANVTVDTTTSSELLVVTATSPDPLAAEATANAFARAYLSVRLSDVLDDLRAISDPIQLRLDNINADLVRVQNQLLGQVSEAERTALQIRLSSLFSQRALLEQKLNELILPENLRVGEILQAALYPAAPSSPNHPRTIAFALFVGLALGIGIAFLRDRVDPHIRDRDEFEERARTVVLGMIPGIRSRKKRRAASLPVADDPTSPVAGAYRALRARFLARIFDSDIRTVLVTSPRQGEGKTSVAANLGVAVSAAGKRVILVAADVWNPRLVTFFHIENDRGVQEILDGRAHAVDVIHETAFEGLFVIPAGTALDADPGIRFGRIGEFLSDVRHHAHLVIIDAPPLLQEAEALAFAPLTDATILVADARRTTAESLHEARRQLDQIGASVIGAVMTNVDPRLATLYGSYGRSPVSRAKAGRPGDDTTVPADAGNAYSDAERSDDVGT